MSVNLLFVCGTGVATSTAVAQTVTKYLKEKGIKDLKYKQTNVSSVQSNVEGVDLVVSTTNIPYDITPPVVNGLPILTGANQNKTLEEIYNILMRGRE
ncbi:hypothetical protein TEHN7118_1760 [Tetragenococcus halophilus subsp. halophilus]|uniref:PTS EIIB type-2 domain-containing protein n=1 Tax=Tetragenococcus halophilus subsp. halophilus TaxID=1513897 RepID=A0A2H6CVF4_TETHA|nr:PTS sugar transporter subunit IIB [Tetragenococcus halophilus]GBD68954.1 hypothetical protein TEHN7118_1760 [Tetragenococcus halophilus subsp. halophilus]